MKLSNEAKVAVTILVAILVAFFGYRVMKDMPLFRQSLQVVSYFERVDGLSAGNYVFINGVKVGSVKSIQLSEGDSVKVTMNFDLGLSIPKNSVAYLQSSGLLDEKTIVIEKGDSEENIEYGGVIKGVYTGSMMESLKDEGQQLSSNVSESFDKLNRLLEQLNKTMKDENRQRIDDLLDNLSSATGDIATLLERKRSDLESSIEHASNFLANLDTVSTENKTRIDSALAGLDRSLREFEKLSSDLQQTNANLNDILAKINNGDGSLGKLVNDPELYNNLNGLSAEMKTLIKNINEDPRKYLKHMRLIEVF